MHRSETKIKKERKRNWRSDLRRGGSWPTLVKKDQHRGAHREWGTHSDTGKERKLAPTVVEDRNMSSSSMPTHSLRVGEHLNCAAIWCLHLESFTLSHVSFIPNFLLSCLEKNCLVDNFRVVHSTPQIGLLFLTKEAHNAAFFFFSLRRLEFPVPLIFSESLHVVQKANSVSINLFIFVVFSSE